MRNAEFDRQAVLRAAMRAFLVKGYAKTSMADLTKATGLHPGSIYCAFENKKGLLLAAISQYHDDRSVQFQHFFTNSNNPLHNLKAYLDNIVQECLSCDATQACLLTKALSEVGEQDEDIHQLIHRNLHAWQKGIEQVLEMAKSQGLIASETSSQVQAQFLMMGIYGLRTFGHTEPSAAVLQPLADKLFTSLLN
ncbi:MULTISPECIES: TetR/AcrR family transcriptional regulator [Pseudomonadati]|uniref:TetR/AcrR family transcriptional regulator n=1 Tax=Shewanella aestuarii TaxID=1028752 RepID=A0ABT0L1J5_9GAMM|nr:TetR/AcrR family transcriptional regulator [Shewanella aestuarii]MCL1117335.1 TetR/AcrR family transcriptional regulator [Shewanella aestuarii]GGN74732.1 TetR family transcriptional regulator [Shewanella aestuarii]